MTPGLTSITFRNKTVSEIVELVKKSGLSSIEWGGDIHCPPNDEESARLAFVQTKKAGLAVSSYGSYFRLGVNNTSEFDAVCATAILLGTDTVRIWAYNKDHDLVTPEEYHNCISEAKTISEIAKKHGITVCFEYHRGTLTRSAVFSKKLIRDIDRENIRLYWQPNPEISHKENCIELETVLPYVVNIHCFDWTWDGKNVRHPLSHGTDEWKNYLLLAQKGNVQNVLIEFVKDDTDAQLYEDAAALCKML
ncbi:MAG: sugar phosphate isomerase/epimerase [Ruminococcaceae bacterium]|nr:sugar phosphate isomerase/epimerase [Oscillospiraceae bacterium]